MRGSITARDFIDSKLRNHDSGYLLGLQVGPSSESHDKRAGGVLLGLGFLEQHSAAELLAISGSVVAWCAGHEVAGTREVGGVHSIGPYFRLDENLMPTWKVRAKRKSLLVACNCVISSGDASSSATATPKPEPTDR